MKNEKNAPEGGSQSRLYPTSTQAQRQRLLKALREAGGKGVTTIQARERLDVMMPAARVHELRHNFGFNIQLLWTVDEDAQRNKHRCAQYVLTKGKWAEKKAA